MNKLINRFLQYVKYETTSDESSASIPSTSNQFEFAKILGKELEEIGLANVSVDENGYIIATLPSNIDKNVPTIGFIAHMDTTEDMSGKNVNPKIISNYDGKNIVLNDEKIGRGADCFDVKKFDADFAYTVDGGPVGELEYENFNAATANIFIQGRNVHPGTAKNKMLNSILIATELNSMLPINERPEYTEGYEGFYHIKDFNGSVEKTEISYIIRDHSMEKFQIKKETLTKVIEFLNYKYGDIITLEIIDSYYNMKEKIEPVMYIVDIAKKAMEELNIEPLIKPIRGGTDGSRLSYMGLPCPNLFTGGHNFHGKFEYIPTFSMERSVDTILKIIELVQEM